MIELVMRKQMDRSFTEQIAELKENSKFALEISRLCFDSTTLEEIIIPFEKSGVCESLTVVSCRNLQDFFHEWERRALSSHIKTLTLVKPTADGIKALTTELLSKRISVNTLKIHTSLTPTFSASLAHALNGTGIQALDLSQCHFDRRSVEVLADGFIKATRMSSLNLNSCHLEDSLLAKILDCLRHHAALRELNISFNNCHSEACESIGALLETSNIEHLKMAQQFIGRRKCLNIKSIARSLARNTRLKSLDLKENFLDTGHLEGLLDALTENETLVDLDLSCTDISDGAIPCLAAKLYSTNIQCLSLLHNPFKNADRLVSAAKENQCLRRINVDASVDSREMLYYYTALNKARRDLLTENRVPLSLWPNILEKASKIDIPQDLDLQTLDIVYYMLQGPALLR